MFKLRRYLAGHYAECVLAPLFKMLEALLQLLVPLVMAQVIDVGIATRDAGYVLAHGALLVGMGVLAWVVAVTAQFFCSRLAAAFGTAMRDDLFAHVLSLSREDVERLGRASLVTRLTNDSQQVQDGLNMFFRLILRSPFVTFGTVIAAFLVDGVEGAALLVAVLVAGALVLGFMRATTNRYRDIQRGLDEVQLGVSENLEGVRVLRAFRREASEREAFARTARTVRDRQVTTGDISALVNPLTYVTVNCGLVSLLWFGGAQVNVGNLTQGQLVALVSYVSQALVELLKLTNLIVLLAKASACAKRINEVFETEPTLADGTLDAAPEQGAPALAFDDVSFSYPGAAGDALSHVSFALAPGATLGVIGGTGSGKSTLASLALRFYDVTGGEVEVGGHDVRDLTRHTLRRQVSLVEQGATLFSGTIASNLRWGDPRASEKDLEAAVATAQATGSAASRASFAVSGVVFYPALLGSSSVSATSKVGIIVTTVATILASILAGALSSERTVKGLFRSIYPASWLVSTVVFVIYSIVTDDLDGAGIFLLVLGGALLGLGWGFVAAGVSAVVFHIVRKISSPGK